MAQNNLLQFNSGANATVPQLNQTFVGPDGDLYIMTSAGAVKIGGSQKQQEQSSNAGEAVAGGLLAAKGGVDKREQAIDRANQAYEATTQQSGGQRFGIGSGLIDEWRNGLIDSGVDPSIFDSGGNQNNNQQDKSAGGLDVGQLLAIQAMGNIGGGASNALTIGSGSSAYSPISGATGAAQGYMLGSMLSPSLVLAGVPGAQFAAPALAVAGALSGFTGGGSEQPSHVWVDKINKKKYEMMVFELNKAMKDEAIETGESIGQLALLPIIGL